MKGIIGFLVLVVLMGMCIIVFSITPRDNVPPQNGRAHMESLPADSEYAGSYMAARSNYGQSWDESDEFTVTQALLHPRVGLGYSGKVTLFARPDYQWVWKTGSLFSSPGYYLEKK